MEKSLKLHSPAGSEPIYYEWPLVITNTRDEAAEIIESIRWVCEDFPELRFAFQNIIMKEYDSSCFESMTQLCNRYNKAIDSILQLWKGRAPPPKMFKRPNRELLRHIINLCYNHAVTEPEKLNIYEPFSPEVYGETSFDMISQMLDEINLGPQNTFMDLGSGVGQVVLQVAASVNCKECYGIEKADTPTEFAVAMEKEFKKWMSWFGKIHSPLKLEKGDFLMDDTKLRIAEADIIFVNNFAFGPKVDHQLKIRFQSLKEGAKVVSSREFCPINFKFNSRNLSELGAMMKVTELKPRNQSASVSWTGKGVSYYVHVVDRTRLEKYFSILKKKKQGLPLDDDERSMCSESNNSSMFEGGVNGDDEPERLEDNLDALYLGATTRHQWQVLVSTLAASKKEHAEKKAQDRRDREMSKSMKLNKKLMKLNRNQSQNLQGKLKKKIMEKYEKQKRKKEIFRENPPAMKNGPGRPMKKKSEEVKKRAVGRPKLCVIDEESISSELDHHFAAMKTQYMTFIKKMNSKEYAHKVSLMIEYEKLKKSVLQKEVMRTELQVQGLINDGLKLFTKRIGELNIAVETPRDLLLKSKTLSAKHHDLQNQMLTMESDVSFLEDKYKKLCRQKDVDVQADLGLGADATSGSGAACDVNLSNKLCSAIIDTLNHRKNLLDEFKDVKEQVSVLEKVTEPCGSMEGKRKSGTDIDEPISKRKKDADDDRAKTKPVALVPPRMQSNSSRASPLTQPGKRSKQKRKCKDSIEGIGKSDNMTNPGHQRYSYPPDIAARFHNRDFSLNSQHLPPFIPEEISYSVYRSVMPHHSEQANRVSSYKHENRSYFDRYPREEPLHPDLSRSEVRSQYPANELHRSYSNGNSSFLNATRSLLQMNSHGNPPNANANSSDMLNSSFPPHVSSTTPFWQQYANLAKSIIGKDGTNRANTSLNSDTRHSDGSSTDTASITSQEEISAFDSVKSPSLAKEQRPSSAKSFHSSKSDRCSSTPTKSSTPILLGNFGKTNNVVDPKTRDPERTFPVSESSTVMRKQAFKLNPDTTTKRYLTPSAIASFPHLTKGGGPQNHSVNAMLNSQQSLLEKAAFRAMTNKGASPPVGKSSTKAQSSTVVVVGKKNLHSASSIDDVISSKDASKETHLIGSSITDYDVLKQLGKQIALQNGTMRTKVVLSDLSLPASSGVFSPPIMTYNKLIHSQSSSKNKSTSNDIKRPIPPGPESASVILPSHCRPKSGNPSVGGHSTSSHTQMQGVVTTDASLVISSPNNSAQTWSPKPSGLPATRLPTDVAVAKTDRKVLPKITIYKPGIASGAKSSRKSNVNQKGNAVSRNETIASSSTPMMTSSQTLPTSTAATLATSQVIPNPSDRVLYRNPVMTILPAHSRLLVVPNMTSSPSITTNAASFSTVLYINSQNQSQQSKYPVVVSNTPASSAGTMPASSNATSILSSEVKQHASEP